jgi:hypothetical protein
MKMLLAASAAALFLTAPFANATTIDFEDVVASSGGSATPNGYAGFNWDNAFTQNAIAFGGGYENAVVSGTNIIYGGFGLEMGFGLAAGSFTLNSLWVTTTLQDTATLLIRGLFEGVDIFDVTADISRTPTLFTLNWAGVDEIRLFGIGNAVLGVDDITFNERPVVNAIPLPASALLLGAGLAGLTLLRRRRAA